MRSYNSRSQKVRSDSSRHHKMIGGVDEYGNNHLDEINFVNIEKILGKNFLDVVNNIESGTIEKVDDNYVNKITGIAAMFRKLDGNIKDAGGNRTSSSDMYNLIFNEEIKVPTDYYYIPWNDLLFGNTNNVSQLIRYKINTTTKPAEAGKPETHSASVSIIFEIAARCYFACYPNFPPDINMIYENPILTAIQENNMTGYRKIDSIFTDKEYNLGECIGNFWEGIKNDTEINNFVDNLKTGADPQINNDYTLFIEAATNLSNKYLVNRPASGISGPSSPASPRREFGAAPPPKPIHYDDMSMFDFPPRTHHPPMTGGRSNTKKQIGGDDTNITTLIDIINIVRAIPFKNNNFMSVLFNPILAGNNFGGPTGSKAITSAKIGEKTYKFLYLGSTLLSVPYDVDFLATIKEFIENINNKDDGWIYMIIYMLIIEHVYIGDVDAVDLIHNLPKLSIEDFRTNYHKFLLSYEFKDKNFHNYIKPELDSTVIIETDDFTTNLDDSHVLKFYEDTINDSANFDTYNRFFKLVDTSGTRVPLNSAITDDATKYRLVPRRESDPGEMRGGGNGDDLVFFSILPALTAPVTVTIEGTSVALDPGQNFIGQVARNAYANLEYDIDVRSTTGGSPVKYKKTLVEIKDIVSSPDAVVSVGAYDGAMERLANRDDKDTTRWINIENNLNENILQQANKDQYEWKYKDGKYEAKTGATVDQGAVCNFVDDDKQDCMRDVIKCIESKECDDMIDLDYKSNMDPTFLKEAVVKINPIIAYEILKRFAFGSIEEIGKDAKLQGIKYYKVQSVNSWIKDFKSEDEGRECGNMHGDMCGSIYKVLGKPTFDKIKKLMEDNKPLFFEFLSYLVEWVNANPQVLNRELNFGNLYQAHDKDRLKPDKQFDKFYNVSPYKKASDIARRVRCSVQQVSSVIGGVRDFGWGYLQSGGNVQMPLNRNVIGNPHSKYSYEMDGGRIASHVSNEIELLKTPFAYETFKDIYSQLEGAIKLFDGATIATKTTDEINTKLEKLKNDEVELQESLLNFYKRIELFKASGGKINPFNTDNEEFKYLLKKHAGLLQQDAAYTRRATNLLDVYNTLAKAIEEMARSYTNSKNGNERVHRPLNRSYTFKKR